MAKTRTALDARIRMDEARAGSLEGHPSLEYLETLSSEIRDWQRAVDEAMYIERSRELRRRTGC